MKTHRTVSKSKKCFDAEEGKMELSRQFQRDTLDGQRMIIVSAVLFAAIFLSGTSAAYSQEKPVKNTAAEEKIEPKDFSGLIGMDGFSDTLLNNHFVLYRGYVNNANILNNKLAALLAEKKSDTPEYAELKRRFGWELNGALLHEYYFENLGGNGSPDVEGVLVKKIAEDFGGFEAWKRDFISTGLMRGIGWAVLYWDPRTGKLVNVWVNEHDVGHLAGGRPILVMDVFEHSYMTDYQLDRAKYIAAFFKHINWAVVTDRFKKGLTNDRLATSEPEPIADLTVTA